MRTKTQIINERNEVQNIYDILFLEIAQGNAHIKLTNDNSIIPSINKKIDAFREAEVQLRKLEQELANAKE